MRPYFTSASSAALVAGPAARVVQDSDARPPVLVRSCPGIPCRWFSATLEQGYCVLLIRGRWLSTEHPGDRGQDLCSCRLRVWNSSLSDLRKTDLSYSRFRRLLKTFYLDSPTTAHCELCFEIFLFSTYLLTYLLNYSGRTLRITMKCIQTKATTLTTNSFADTSQQIIAS